jgi:hypothetical protein
MLVNKIGNIRDSIKEGFVLLGEGEANSVNWVFKLGN